MKQGFAAREVGGTLVIRAVGRGKMRPHAILGDRMAGMGVQNGWSGVLVNGHVRDTPVLARMPLGVHALGAMPNRPAAMAPAQAGEHVRIQGVTVRTGDWLYADTDGVIVLARRHAPVGG